MKIKLQLKSWHFILLLNVLVFTQDISAQCTDNTIRPSDGFAVSPWAPRCNNGNDGELRITGISSTAGSNNYTNRSYAVRIISGPNGPMNFPIPSNAADYIVTGLSGGAYVIDIIDQCGGNSADKSVIIPNPAPNNPTVKVIFGLKDRLNSSTLTGCGNVLKYSVSITSLGTSGNVTYVLTNNIGQTLSFTKAIPRIADALIHVYQMDLEIPLDFFNGGNLTYTGSNLCGPVAGGTIIKPVNNDIVYGLPSLRDVSDPSNACNMGYDIKVFRDFMTNPVTVSVEETARPGVTPVNFAGNPINPQTINLLHLNSVPMAFATQVNVGLKYNTHYTIRFTDACGLTVVKPMIQNSAPFEPSFSCGTYITVSDIDGYFEDTAVLKYNCVAIASKAVGPLTVTVNSGPATYTTSSGNGNSVTANAITYPYSTTISSPFLDTYLTIDNLRTFPSGSYNLTVSDACGKTSTFSVNAPCSRNFNVSHTLQSCGSVNENVNVQIAVPKAIYGTRATIYKSDGSIALTGVINFGAPFYYTQLAASGALNISLLNNVEYVFRYGGVGTAGQLCEPAQFGGVGALPRLTGGYLYQYTFRVQLQQFRFSSIEACGSTVNMTATGGAAPYTFTLLNGSGTTQLFPNQTEATFTGLVTGTIYTAKATDNCGREFTQQFEVFPFPVPFIQSTTHPDCTIASGSVVLGNLPSDWTITQTPGGNTYTGTTGSFSITGLAAGDYIFSIRDNITLCRDNESLSATILQRPGCPIASDDIVNYTIGSPTYVNILANDTTGQPVNPRTVSLVPTSHSINIIRDAHGNIVSMTIEGEGIWAVNPVTGQVSFTPAEGFTGTPSSIEYNVEDFSGHTSNNATIKIDILPIAIDDSSEYSTGAPVIINLTNNDTTGDRINPATVTLILPGTPDEEQEADQIRELTISGEGVWQICATTGAATFTPQSGFTGVPSQQKYRIRDFEGNLSNIALITLTEACQFDVSCPTFSPATVACYGDLPSTTDLTISEFESLGNADGRISNTYCGVIEIKAVNSPYRGCNSTITRTYTINEFQDGNNNGRRDSEENTIMNSVTCTQEIRIEDRIAPAFTGVLPSNMTVECNAVPTAATVTAADNCGTAVVAFNEVRTEGNCVNNFTLTRTWTATDACGNNRFHSQVITVQDTTAPTFTGTLPGDVTIECNSEAPLAARITAVDNCGTAAITFNQEVINGSCSGEAEIIRTWTATDECGNESSFTQTISVRDTTPPTFLGEMPQQNISADCSKIPVAPVVAANDNCSSATVTYEETQIEGDCKSKPVLVRKWTATDSCGNATTYIQNVNLTCHIQIYNAVSPDGDGRNDIFYLEGIECFPNNSVEIFNRWGAKVFETQGYDNTTKVFRGKSEGKNTVSGNEELPSGTYYYVLKYDFNIDGNDHENIEKAGYLYIANK